MILECHAILDMKANLVRMPFFCRSSVEAIRMVGNTAKNKESDLFHHASDFTLVHLSNLDDETGQVIVLEPPTPRQIARVTDIIQKGA